MTDRPAPEPEMLIKEWLRENDRERAHVLMNAMVGDHAEPVIRRIVSFKLTCTGSAGSRAVPSADIDDVCNTAIYHLLARLERLKAAGGDSVISSFAGYAAVTAYNACNEYFRARRPAWLSLANKVRYLITHAAQFALWDGDDGREICGLASWRHREPASDGARLSEAGRKFRRQHDPSRLKPIEVVTAVLEAAGAPLTFDELVDAVADWTALKEAQLLSIDQDRSEQATPWEPADREAPADTRMIDREFMGRLWKEILELSLEHRRALLLNLDDSAGGDIQLFEALGIASIRQIAAALEMDALEFAELWKKLPMDDVSIAGMLGISRQDVANRRSSARKRLARRMLELRRGN